MIIFAYARCAKGPSEPLTGIPYFINEAFSNSGGVKIVENCTTTIRSQKKRETLSLGWQACKAAKSGDLVFGWGEIAFFAWLFNQLFFHKRCVFLGLNLIFQKERRWSVHHPLNYPHYLLYRWAFGQGDFYMTVNAPELIDFYSDLFARPRDRFKLVYDPARLSPQERACAERPYDGPPYVFCGGKAYRDIPTFLAIVRSLPGVQFRAIFPAKLLTPEMDTLPNLTVLHDVPHATFYDTLAHATLCVIPLKSEIPCGLLVMQHAALMHIPIVSTRTRSMRTVVPDDNHGFLLPMGDAPAMAARIEQLLADRDLARRIADNAYANMRRFDSPVVAQQLADVMHEVMPESVPKVTVRP